VKLKIALAEASHWHVPLYVEGLNRLGHKLIALSDSNKKLAIELGRNLNCTAYGSYEELVVKEKPDFVFAFGKHADMPQIGEFLIKEKIPFVIEKPSGTSSQQIKELLALQSKVGTFVAVPLVFRYSPLMDEISSIQRKGELGTLTHCYFRFIAGSPQRYIQANSSWMLDPSVAGGGCTINLAVHFIDLFLYLAQDRVRYVYAALNSLTHKTDIEDFSVVVLRTKKDQVGIIETGYTYPQHEQASREIYYGLTTTKGFMWARDDTLHWIRRANKKEKVTKGVGINEYHSIYVRKVLEEFLKDTGPRTSLKEMYKVMKIIEAVYKSAREGKVVKVV
jgi:predicted dehydrogenase